MTTINELMKQGAIKIKLPQWNEFAYLELTKTFDGEMYTPWATLHDVNYAEKTTNWLADTDDRWIIVE